jgi:putative ABC transport system permease protein
MWRNYFKTATRNLFKHKIHSIINIIGLSIGLSVSILIFLYVNYEYSYDNFHENADRIYRISVNALIGNTEIHQTGTAAPMPAALYKEFPEVERATRIHNIDETTITINQKTYLESNVFFVDSSFFDMFTFKVVEGQKEHLLNSPNTVVVTESFAKKYFPDKSSINEVIVVDFYRGVQLNLKISAVVNDIPTNSHFHSEIFVSMVSTPNDFHNIDNWGQNYCKNYIMLKSNSTTENIEKRFPDFFLKYEFGDVPEDKLNELLEKNFYWEYFLQPIKDIHLHSDLNREFEVNGNYSYVRVLILIAVFILIIASINFMNLSTAISSIRAKEVGVRKVIGATKKKLMAQFLIESVLISFIALIIGMVIIEAILPYYQNFIQRPIEIKYFDNFYILPILIGFSVVVGLISGIYPGLVLSQFKPILVLKSKLIGSKKNAWFKNILVVFQFSIAIVLIIGTFIITKQVNLVQNKNLGFDKEKVVFINNAWSLDDKFDVFVNEIMQNPNIDKVSISNTLPGKEFSNIGFDAEGFDDPFTLNLCRCDENYLNVLNLEMVNGRFFSPEYGTDSSAIIINEATAELLGYEDPIGKTLYYKRTNPPGEVKVIGVVRDFHYESMHTKIRPQGIMLLGGVGGGGRQYISCKLNTSNITGTVDFLENKWKIYAKDMPFDFSFLDKDYDNIYANEVQTKKLFIIFSILAIFIACLGLIGLASFVAQQKTKEIGIRKVHGALIQNIFILLSTQFTKWVLFANILAWPVAWYLMNSWLQSFVYKTEISGWIFIITGLITAIIAFLTISFQSVYKARMNPVKALRYE